MNMFKEIISNAFNEIYGIIRMLNSSNEIPTKKCVEVIGAHIDSINNAIYARDMAFIERIEAVKDSYVRNYQELGKDENMDTIRVCNDLIELIRSDYNG